MRIATYNVNGVNGRLPVLLRWLEQTNRRRVLARAQSARREVSFSSDSGLRLWCDLAWQKQWNGVAILARGQEPEERQRGLRVIPTICIVAISKLSSMGL